VLESAFFIPEIISGKARRYGVSSDAAYRFERGVDPCLQLKAITYAASLITKYCGGQIGEISHIGQEISQKSLQLSINIVNRILGIEIDQRQIIDILIALGFAVEVINSELLKLQVPTFRFDINIVEDVIEEIARVYGYDNIPALLPTLPYNLPAVDEKYLGLRKLQQKLLSLGYSEIVSYAFLEEAWYEHFATPTSHPIRLQNPIAGLNVMRTSLIPDLVKSLVNNINRGHKMVRIFEIARVFAAEEEGDQELKAAGLIWGNYTGKVLDGATYKVDFFSLKHDVELILSGNHQLRFVPEHENTTLHSGRCAKIYIADRHVGVIGQLHPRFAPLLGLNELPYVFELDLLSVIDAKPVLSVTHTSKFPKVERDLAFVLHQNTLFGEVLAKINEAQINFLLQVNVFDIYSGDKLEQGYKSVAINCVFQANKTLTEDEINTALSQISSIIEEGFAARLRR
jgi:phenylalanyl-tRNA synthetase beta chain